jgi:uncharacterized protein (DUF305 family)
VRPSSTRLVVATLVALLPVGSCSRAARTPGGASPAPQILDPVTRARSDTARPPWTEADASFLTGMIGHHAQAIAMSRLAASHGASHSIRTLAERIINAQQDEIALMQQWLRERSQPVPEVTPSGQQLPMDGRHHGHMPGMLTSEQLAQLDAARDKAFDRMFLTFMIQHHRGAVSMVQTLIGTTGAARDDTVFKIAADINVDQETEIARMERMLAAMLFERKSP